ncbi:MAG: hypothetical protein HKN47_19025 [Pirellulaceae bacterium]|nr:hypothetical protein [Pirellulaceae bacterium]
MERLSASSQVVAADSQRRSWYQRGVELNPSHVGDRAGAIQLRSQWRLDDPEFISASLAVTSPGEVSASSGRSELTQSPSSLKNRDRFSLSPPSGQSVVSRLDAANPETMTQDATATKPTVNAQSPKKPASVQPATVRGALIQPRFVQRIWQLPNAKSPGQRYQVSGKLRGVSRDVVWIEIARGKVFRLPMNQLTAADRQHALDKRQAILDYRAAMCSRDGNANGR